jgi:hypothetical protein
MRHSLYRLLPIRWIGRSIMAVACIHSFYTLVIFREQIDAVVARGIFDSVTTPMIGAGTWFFFFGPPLFLVGVLIDWAEKNAQLPLPRSVAWVLSLLTMLGIIMMPESGFYLMIPSLIGLFHKQKSDNDAYNWSHPR